MNTATSATLNVVTVKGLRKAVEIAAETGTTLFVNGTFGIGKTEIVSARLKELGYTPVDWFRGSTMEPTVVAGIPYLDEGVLRRAVPEIIDACLQVQRQGGRPALVMDELNIATPFMLGALLQLLLEGRLGEYQLPEGTPIICMGNLETDGSIVNRLPLPAANRMRQLRFTGPTFEEWEGWATANQVHPAVVSMLRETPQLLVEYERANVEDRDRTRWATPRTWKMVSDHLPYAEDIDDAIAIAASFVGDAAASRLNMHMRLSFQLESTDNIIANPDQAHLPDPSNTPQCYMQVQQLMAQCPADEAAARAALRYLKRMEPTWKAVALGLARNRKDLLRQLYVIGAIGAMDDSTFDAFAAADEIAGRVPTAATAAI